MSRPNFDRVARLYRPAEYLTFGPLLERCRFHHLPALASCRNALILGDGDGRFLARLLALIPELRAHAVDISPAMLRLLHGRVAEQSAEPRLKTTCTDARAFSPPADAYDLVVTHFFLDCLTTGELDELIARLRPHLAPGALWLVSEFQVPAGSRIRAALARTLISGLYAGFRVLTGLRVRHIPAWQEHLARAGFTCQRSQTWAGGLLVSEVWQATASTPSQSHQLMPAIAEPELKSPTFPNDRPGIDPGPLPGPTPTPEPTPEPAPGPDPEPDPIPYPGPPPTPQPIT